MPHSHRIAPGSEVRIADLPTRGDGFHDGREAAEKEFRQLRKRLAELQHRLWAANREKLLVVFQAMDAGGKDGSIRRVFEGVNPQGVRVTSFKAPTAVELAHDYLWRIHRAVPGAGEIGVFNRSHYEDVLVVRVEGLVPEAVWKRRYEEINQFEKLLAASGTAIVKFYLHISKDEQKKRLEARLENPRKNWKFSRDDLDKRRFWDAYMAAYEDALQRCSTASAPWHAIPADQKWYRNLALARVLVARLEEIDPRYPEPEPGLEAIRVV